MEDNNKQGRKRGWVAALVVLIVLALGYYAIAQPDRKPAEENGKLKVVTTLFPLYDIAKHIGGNKVEVSLLLPPGMEAHSFDPSPSDILAISQADVFAYTGPAMEPWAEDILASQPDSSLIVVNGSDGLDMMAEEEEDGHEEGENEEDEHGGVDPHVWLDFDNAKHMATAVGQALAQANPEDASYFSANTQAYIDRLSQLDEAYEQGLSQCQTRAIVYGGHYAFGYLAKRYNLEYVAAQGLAADAEPTPGNLVSLVRQIRKDGIATVFYEELSSPKIAETLAEETGAQLKLLSAAHNVSREDLEGGVSFFDIMEANLENLRNGLGCQ